MWAGDRDRVSVVWLKQVDDVISGGTSADPLDCKEKSKHQLDTAHTYIIVVTFLYTDTEYYGGGDTSITG